MTIPVFDSKRNSEELAQHAHEAMNEVLASGSYLFGPGVAAFEHALADFFGVAPARVVACHSGTDALILSLLAADVGPGDEVLVPANTAVPTAAAVKAVGAIPVFCDVNANTWTLDPLSCLENLTPVTKAIIPVHLFGNSADVNALRTGLARAGRADVKIVEDCAQSFGGALNGRPLGAHGDFGAFSFYPTKNLGAAGDGGAVLAATEEMASKLRALAFYGQFERNKAMLARGINSRLDELQARILLRKLATFPENVHARTHLMRKYRELARDFPVVFQEQSQGCSPAWHLAVIRTECASMRDRLREHLRARGVETLVHYPVPLHLQPAFQRECRLPTAERLAGEILTLPFSHLHTEQEIADVMVAVRSFFLS